jgi:hypothetical protein
LPMHWQTPRKLNIDCHVIFSRVDSQDNLADSLSRGDLDQFRLAASARSCSVAPSATTARLPRTDLCEQLQSTFFCRV